MSRCGVTIGIVAALAVGALAVGCLPARHAIEVPASVSEPAVPSPAAAPSDEMDGDILRAARTPIAYQPIAREPLAGRDLASASPSLARLVAGIAPRPLEPAAGDPAAGGPAPQALAAPENSAMWSASKMGLILTRKIVLPATMGRQPLDESAKMPGPDKPSGTDRAPGPTPSPAPGRLAR